jgi:hypothetical protein
MQARSRFDLPIFFASLYLIGASLTIMRQFVPVAVTFMMFVAWFVLTWGFRLNELLANRHLMRTVFCFLWVMIVPFGYLIHSETKNTEAIWSQTKSPIMVMAGLLIFAYYVRLRDGHGLRVLVHMWLLATVMSSLLTIRAEIVHPFASRAVTGMRDVEGMTWDTFEAIASGVGNFSDVYGMALKITPLLFATWYVRGWTRFWFLATTLVSLACVLKASYLIAVLALVLGVMALCVNAQRMLSRSWAWAAFLLIFAGVAVALQTAGPDIFRRLAHLAAHSDNPVYEAKFSDIAAGLAERKVALLPRWENYHLSWTAFLGAPLFGQGFDRGYDLGGGHSQILDTLCYFGLVNGALPIVALFYNANKYLNAAVYRAHPVFLALRRAFVVPLVFCCLTNPIWGFSPWGTYFLFVPALPFFFVDRRTGWPLMAPAAGPGSAWAPGSARRREPNRAPMA